MIGPSNVIREYGLAENEYQGLDAVLGRFEGSLDPVVVTSVK